jgi:hypothetical protein
MAEVIRGWGQVGEAVLNLKEVLGDPLPAWVKGVGIDRTGADPKIVLLVHCSPANAKRLFTRTEFEGFPVIIEQAVKPTV